MDLFDVALVAIVAFTIGSVYGGFRQNMRFIQKVSKDPQHMIDLLIKLKTELERIKEAEDAGADEDAIELRFEQHNGIYFCYRKDNEQFMGQGNDIETLIKQVNDRTGLNVWARKPEQSNQTAC
jgi:hypothetical protein